MTDQETIEKATRIMASTPPADLIQALADAGLLADEATTADLTIHLMKRKKAEAERDALAATVQRVRGLHAPKRSMFTTSDVCDHCIDAYSETPEHWPCPTIRALDDPQEQP